MPYVFSFHNTFELQRLQTNPKCLKIFATGEHLSRGDTEKSAKICDNGKELDEQLSGWKWYIK